DDCGLCSVCGNMKCEPPYETCTNCAMDCGACTTMNTCIETVTCAFGCFSGMGFSATCVTNCVSQGCANAQFFVDQVLNCAVKNIPQCIGGGGIVNCLMKECQ